MDKDNTANKNIGSSKTPDPTLHSFTPSIKDALKKITSYKGKIYKVSIHT